MKCACCEVQYTPQAGTLLSWFLVQWGLRIKAGEKIDPTDFEAWMRDWTKEMFDALEKEGWAPTLKTLPAAVEHWKSAPSLASTLDWLAPVASLLTPIHNEAAKSH